MRTKLIYLDNNATTPMDPRVREAMLPFLGELFGNPSSPYTAGRAARDAVEEARGNVAALIGADPDGVVFTSGGTESINTAVRAALAAQPGKRHIVTTTIEHSATKALCEKLIREGCEVTWIPVDANGQPDPAVFTAALRPDTAIATVVWANNETGVILPVAELARIADERRIVFHADAVQAVGKLPVDLRSVPVHLMSLSAHKFHGPKGAGALFVRPGLGLPALILGGGQERGRRAGTENVAGLVGTGMAAGLATSALTTDLPRVAALRDHFESGVSARFPEVRFHGNRGERLANTTNFALPGLEAHALLIGLDRLGVACSIGSACTSGIPDASHVLRAMGVTDSEAKASLRFSFSRMNTTEEADAALEALVGVAVNFFEKISCGEKASR
jgi:cysteine desulfurase